MASPLDFAERDLAAELSAQFAEAEMAPPGELVLHRSASAVSAVTGSVGEAPRLTPKVGKPPGAQNPWILIDARDDRETLRHAPRVERQEIAEAIRGGEEWSTRNRGQYRLVIAHEVDAAQGGHLAHEQVLTVSEAQGLIRTAPSTARAALNLERGVLTAHRAKEHAQRLLTPRNLKIIGGTVGSVLVASAIPALLAAAAAAAALDPVVYLQCTLDGQAWATTPVTSWDW